MALVLSCLTGDGAFILAPEHLFHALWDLCCSLGPEEPWSLVLASERIKRVSGENPVEGGQQYEPLPAPMARRYDDTRLQLSMASFQSGKHGHLVYEPGEGG